MKTGCRKHNGILAGLAGIISLACSPHAYGADYVPLTSFSTNPTAAGWQEASGSGTGGDTTTWDSTNGWLSAGTSSTGGGWYTPVFNPTPGQYYEIQYDAKLTTTDPSGKAFCWVNYGNPGATYNLESTLAGGPLYKTTSTGTQLLSGQLLADNATSIQPSLGTSLGNGWTHMTLFTRTPVNATQSSVYFGSNGSSPASGVLIDNVEISPATHTQVLSYADGLYNNTTNFPVKMSYTPPANRFANLPNTYTKLSTGKNLNVVLLGDSIMGDTSNSYFDTMIERNFTGSSVTVYDAQGHGTGMNAWLNPDSSNWTQAPLKLQQAVYNQPADLVVIGGISNGLADTNPSTLVNQAGTNEFATKAIVEALKAQGKEVLLTTGDFGSNGSVTINASQLVANVDGSTTGSDYTLAYRNWLCNLAKSEGVGFFDTYGAWGSYYLQLRAAGMSDPTYYRDQWTHGNTVGKDIVGELYSGYFTPVPEPTSVAAIFTGMAFLMRRPRRSM